MAGKAGCHQKEYRCESRTPRIGAAAAVLNCMTDWAKASTRGREAAGGTKAWPCGTQHGALVMDRKRGPWFSSGASSRLHGPAAAPPHRLRVCRPLLFNQGVCLLLQERQCAAMADAVRCVGRCSALHRHMHRVAFFGPMFSVCSQSGSYGPTLPETPTLQSRSYILHILFHWGEEHDRRFRAFLSIVQRKLSNSLTRPSPLSKENTPDHQRVTPLCSKKTPRSASKSQSFVQRSSTNSLRVPLHRP